MNMVMSKRLKDMISIKTWFVDIGASSFVDPETCYWLILLKFSTPSSLGVDGTSFLWEVCYMHDSSRIPFCNQSGNILLRKKETKQDTLHMRFCQSAWQVSLMFPPLLKKRKNYHRTILQTNVSFWDRFKHFICPADLNVTSQFMNYYDYRIAYLKIRLDKKS